MYQTTNASLVQNAIFKSLSQLFQRNKSVALSNEALIKLGAKLCPPISYHNAHIWDFLTEEKQFISHSKCNHKGECNSNATIANCLI